MIQEGFLSYSADKKIICKRKQDKGIILQITERKAIPARNVSSTRLKRLTPKCVQGLAL